MGQVTLRCLSRMAYIDPSCLGNARPKQMVLLGRGVVSLLVDQDLLRLPALGEQPEGRIA